MLFFYWLIAVMPLDQHPLWGKELVGTFTIIKAVGSVCLLLALFHLALKPEWPPLFRSLAAQWFWLYFSLQCLSYVFHGGRLVGVSGTYSHVFSLFFLFITSVTLIASENTLHRAILVAIGALAFNSLYVIRVGQKYGVHSRPGGMLSDANEYALIAGMWLPLAFLLALHKWSAWNRLFCLGCFLVTLIGTTLAASRGGFLGFVAGFVFLLSRTHRRIRNLAIASVLVLPIIFLSPASPIHRLMRPGYGSQRAEYGRKVVWKAGMAMVQAHPVIGIGLGNWLAVLSSYRDPRDEPVVSLAHNTYIDIAAGLGLPGLAAFLGVLLAVLVTLESARRRAQVSGRFELVTVALGTQAGVISYAVSAVFMSGWWQKMVWLLIFMAISVHRFSMRPVVRIGLQEFSHGPEEAIRDSTDESAAVPTVHP